MIEVKLIEGSYTVLTKTCESGDLAPTIIAILQEYEAERGELKYRQNYAITFRVFK